jgi:hypothetical protein
MYRVDNRQIVATVLALVISVSMASGQSRPLKEKLIGVWGMTDERKILPIDTYHYDRIIEVVKESEIVFDKDHVSIPSGIYSLTGEEWPEGKYPWIYCGTRTLYKISGNKVNIYNPGNRTWMEFSVRINGADSMVLSAGSRSFGLYKKQTAYYNNAIQYVHLSVIDVDQYFVYYEVYIENDRIKVVKDKREIKAISSSYVNYIFKNFDRVDVSQLKELYNSEVSTNRILELDVHYGDGKQKYSRIIGVDHPDELKLALLPVIYAGDFINHKDCWCGDIGAN